MSENNLNDEVVLEEPVNEEAVVLPEPVVEADPLSVEPEVEVDAAPEENVKVEITAHEPVLVDEPVIENLISSPKADKEEKPKKPALRPVANGVLGSSNADKKDVVVEPTVEDQELVAIYSAKNVSWIGIGKIKTGYNIVKKTQADHWLTKKYVRIATPEEVAKEFKK